MSNQNNFQIYLHTQNQTEMRPEEGYIRSAVWISLTLLRPRTTVTQLCSRHTGGTGLATRQKVTSARGQSQDKGALGISARGYAYLPLFNTTFAGVDLWLGLYMYLVSAYKDIHTRAGKSVNNSQELVYSFQCEFWGWNLGGYAWHILPAWWISYSLTFKIIKPKSFPDGW